MTDCLCELLPVGPRGAAAAFPSIREEPSFHQDGGVVRAPNDVESTVLDPTVDARRLVNDVVMHHVREGLALRRVVEGFDPGGAAIGSGIEVDTHKDRIGIPIPDGGPLAQRDEFVPITCQDGANAALLQVAREAAGDVQGEVLLVNEARLRAAIVASMSRINHDPKGCGVPEQDETEEAPPQELSG